MPYQIAQDIYVFQSTIWQTNSPVVLNESANIVIDPCYFPAEIQVIASFTDRRKSFNRYVLFTHSDFDHVVGYLPFKAGKIIAHEKFMETDQEFQMIQLKEIDQIYQVIRKPPFVFPKPSVTFEEEFNIPIKGDELILFYAPGHTEDCIFTVSKEKRVLFAGDYLSDIEFPFVNYSIGDYQRSLDLAEILTREFKIEIVVPGHGDIAEGKEEILERIEDDRRYLSTLMERTQNLLGQGLPEWEITEALKDIKFRNEPIDGPLLKMHVENIKLTLKELQAIKLL